MTDDTRTFTVPMCSRCAYAVAGKASAISLVRARTGGLRDHTSTEEGAYDRMATTDDGLDASSRRPLNEINELKRLEIDKRRTSRSSPEFDELAAKVEKAARHVFDSASAGPIEAQEVSPLQAEPDEQHPGDWTEGSRN